MTLMELWTMLAKHQEHILNKTNFVIDNAPAKLHQEIGRLRASLGQK